MTNLIHAASVKLHHANHGLIHKVHHIAHCTYLGAVAVEAHGIYAYAAGGLLVVVLVSLFSGAEVTE